MVVLPSNVHDANPVRMLHIWAPATGLICYIGGWMCGLIATCASESTRSIETAVVVVVGKASVLLPPREAS